MTGIKPRLAPAHYLLSGPRNIFHGLQPVLPHFILSNICKVSLLQATPKMPKETALWVCLGLCGRLSRGNFHSLAQMEREVSSTVVGKGSRNNLSPLDTHLWGPGNPPIRAGKSSVSWSELAHPLSSPVLTAVTVLDVSLLY